MEVADYYSIARWIHIVSFSVWIGSMMTLLVICAKHVPFQGNGDEGFIALEKTVMKRIVNPAMVLTFVFGIWLVFITGAGAPDAGKWIHIKLLSVLVLVGIHIMISMKRKLLAVHACQTEPNRFYMLAWLVFFNVMIISYLAVFKPF